MPHKKWRPSLLGPIAACVFLVGGCGGGKHAPYRTLPRPPLPPAMTAPNCGSSPANHHAGSCLPHPKGAVKLPRPTASTTIQGPDLSNNDPVYGSGNWSSISHSNRFVYLKSTEGTGYYDSTASAMASFAKAHGLPVGGYDFLHVCGNSAPAEASYFVSSLKSQGLLGAGTLPPAADAEFGSGSCGGRSWMDSWVSTVYVLDGHICPDVYTGAWWWQPNMGSYWPACQGKGLLSWISGYGVSYPYMPSGRSQLDIWQFTDRGWNGVSSADLSVWRDGEQAFIAFSQQASPKPVEKCLRKPYPISHSCGMVRYGYNRTLQDQAKLQARLVQHHCSPRHPGHICRGWRASLNRANRNLADFRRLYA